TPGRTVATLKHFAAYGIPQGGLNGAPAEVGKIALFNEHLRPFRDAVSAGTVMTSYNTIDGVPTTGDKELIDGTLRDRFGFDGAVTSDLFSIDGITGAGTAGDLAEAAAQALLAGVDIDLGANAYRKGLPEALRRGLVTEADIDRAVANVLRLKMRLGLFENSYVEPEKAAAASANPSHGDIARQIALEGTVLLKNNGVLPLDATKLKRVAVIGPNADNAYNQLGDYTAPQPDGHIVTVLDGLRNVLPKSVKIDYVKGCGIRDTTENRIAEAVAVAREADVTVLVVGGSSARDFRTSYEATGAASASQTFVSDMDCGEGFDRASLALLGLQQQLMDSVLATGRPVVVVYIAGRPLDMNRAAESADALLCAWYPGQEGGNAIAELLTGKAEPSGRLCVTIPRNVGQLPIYYSQRGRHDYTDMTASPLYPFGYGLGYTTFDFGDVTLDSDTMSETGSITATVQVTNTGLRKGVAVVQFYDNDRVAEVSRAPKELIG
ncbi:MAG: glycoside hydrolase family 3 C-terminal domain-containing protein, partial [Paramuribaculum sp.]|nr:glycoside hydrolase family 3 C-terminal domain-containing protein [Paramuribaculum sp.]